VGVGVKGWLRKHLRLYTLVVDRLKGSAPGLLHTHGPHQKGRTWAPPRRGLLIDLLPVFADVPDPAAYYYRKDGHWNDNSQERAGRVLAERLIALGLVPSK
jgi:hypothetical protein